jgi:hypothetical protein
MLHPTPLPSRVPAPMPEPGPRPGTPIGVTPWPCVMCFRSASQPGGCCSTTCAIEAQEELDRNAHRLRSRHAGHDAGTARWLAERNGRLSSALLRWRSTTTPRSEPSAVAS